MSSRRGHLGSRLAAAVAAIVLCGAMATAASAFVSVYTNSFNKRFQYREVSPTASAKRCAREFVKKRGVMQVTVKSGPKLCNYVAPVEGDSPRPNHRLDVSGRVLKSTSRRVRDNAYLSISARVGGGDRYELRVFPKDKRFSLRRQPSTGAFPVSGDEGQINPLGEENRLRLTLAGDNVKAHVNGTKVADLNDANSSEVRGRKVEFGVGSTANSKRNVNGSFDRLNLSVPNP